MFAWTIWKPFPDPRHGPPIEAPGGPGVFEVRRISTGDVVVFDHAANVADALASLASYGPRPGLLGGRRPAPADLEYRTCAAATHVDAKLIATRLNSQRRVFLRQVLRI